MKYRAAAVVQRTRQFTTVPCTRRANVAESFPPPAIRQISWCICSWSVPRRRCIGLIAARPAFASWMIESWPSGISGDGPWRREKKQERMCPNQATIFFFTLYISHGELELKLNTDNNTVYVFMDIYRCTQTDIRMGIGGMAPADLFGNRTYGDILWFVRYSFSFFFFFFVCARKRWKRTRRRFYLFLSVFPCQAARGQREILIGGWKRNGQCAQWHFDDDVDCQI